MINENELTSFKASKIHEFKMSNIGNSSYFLGMKFVNSRKGIFLHLQKYEEDILKRLYMRSCNSGITRMEKDINLSKDTNDELVDATLYKKIIN